MDKLKVEYRNPNDLIPYALNAKLHPADQVNKIAASIAEFGFDQPIVIDKKGIIIKGHGRCQAAIKLNMESVPVIVADLSDAMAKASRLADNKVGESDWDNELLKSSIDSLLESVGGSEIDLSSFGFDMSGFDDLIESEDFENDYQGDYQSDNEFDANKYNQEDASEKGHSTGYEYSHFTLGEISFSVELADYLSWIQSLNFEAGFTKEEQILFIRKKLGLSTDD